jgi:hypothetical protein
VLRRGGGTGRGSDLGDDGEADGLKRCSSNTPAGCARR